MLVITRHPGEQIVIDGVIRLTVVSEKGGRIRLGIEAPPSIMVDRQEIRERRQRGPVLVAEPCRGVEPLRENT